jgi:hypothetical protein
MVHVSSKVAPLVCVPDSTTSYEPARKAGILVEEEKDPFSSIVSLTKSVTVSDICGEMVSLKVLSTFTRSAPKYTGEPAGFRPTCSATARK